MICYKYIYFIGTNNFTCWAQEIRPYITEIIACSNLLSFYVFEIVYRVKFIFWCLHFVLNPCNSFTVCYILQKFYKRRPKGLHGALLELGLQFEGREHSGLCDARNTALLAWRMVQDGAVLKITKTLL
jgi:inhibitor of KinA sporulation pathway (predicted exonuclease)